MCRHLQNGSALFKTQILLFWFDGRTRREKEEETRARAVVVSMPLRKPRAARRNKKQTKSRPGQDLKREGCQANRLDKRMGDAAILHTALQNNEGCGQQPGFASQASRHS